MYADFETEFTLLIEEHIGKKNIQKLVDAATRITKKKPCDSSLPKLIAIISAVWSLTKSNLSLDTMNSNGERYLLKPHAVQVLTLFRLLETNKVFSQYPSLHFVMKTISIATS